MDLWLAVEIWPNKKNVVLLSVTDLKSKIRIKELWLGKQPIVFRLGVRKEIENALKFYILKLNKLIFRQADPT